MRNDTCEDQWHSELFQSTFGLSYPLQDFCLPRLTKDCIYLKGDNSFLLQILEGAGPQSSPKWLFPGPELACLSSQAIMKTIHFALFQPGPLSARICGEALKSLLALPPQYCKKGNRDSEWQMFLPLVLFQVVRDSKSWWWTHTHHESFFAATTSHLFIYSTWHVCLLCLLEERPKGQWD